MIDQADVVVIGAGSFGSSPAYHLAKLGMRNVVSAGSVRAGVADLAARGRADQPGPLHRPLTRLAKRSVEKLERFEPRRPASRSASPRAAR